MADKELVKQAKHLEALLQIGKNGVSQGFKQELDHLLKKKELVKIKILNNYDGEVKETAQEVAKELNAEILVVIGKAFVLYRKG
jgi:RNA-binding protein